MELQLREVWPVPYRRSIMSPFEASEDFSQDCWQANELIAASPSDRFYSFMKGSEEVVRMIVVDGRGPLKETYGDPEPVAPFLVAGAVEIDFIETALCARRCGLATKAIQLLRGEYPGRVFVAIPDGSEGFWQSLGWHRYSNTAVDHRRPALYICR